MNLCQIWTSFFSTLEYNLSNWSIGSLFEVYLFVLGNCYADGRSEDSFNFKFEVPHDWTVKPFLFNFDDQSFLIQFKQLTEKIWAAWVYCVGSVDVSLKVFIMVFNYLISINYFSLFSSWHISTKCSFRKISLGIFG